jgi:Zn-dependent M28 family amino/carboxypeptidase
MNRESGSIMGNGLSLLLVLLAALLFGLWFVLAQPFVTPIVSKPPAVDAQRLEAHVRMLSQTLYPRSFDHPDKLEAAAEYIRAELLKAGAQPEDQPVRADEAMYRNVVARFGPKDGPLIVIGAHYDSHGFAAEGAKYPKGFHLHTHTPGADDNASGVAGLLELARLLALSPPPVAVELVAYTLEEPPHFRTDAMGSLWHARRLREQGTALRMMIALEMIGYFSDEPGSQTYPLPGLDWLYPTRGNFVAIIGRVNDVSATRSLKAAMRGATDLPVHSMNSLALIPGVDFSDHRSYWAQGYSAVMVTDTAFYRNPHYHRGTDTAERLDYVRMSKVVQGVFALTQSDAAR